MSLPSGYKKLEYIQSSGTQYIDTNFKANQNTRLVFDFAFISSDLVVVMGACNAGRVGWFALQAVGGKWYYYYGTDMDYTTADVVAGARIVVDCNKNKVYADGTLIRTATENVFSGDYPIILSAMQYQGSVKFVASLTIYSCQIYDNGTLVRDFIPCKNATGVIGLWDDVNSVFYQNAGTGTFTAGPEVKGAHKVLIGGTAYDIKGGKCLINGTAYTVKKGRTLIGGTGYDISFASGTPISELPVGSTVKIAVNGTLGDFLIVHQGLPSSLYDDSCNGTWLLMKDCYESRAWHSLDINSYKASTINSYLNSTFLALFESNIQEAIKQVKIPYAYEAAAGFAVASGANGLSTKIFLLSGYEVGWTRSTSSYFPIDGDCLSYFSGLSATDSKRIAYLNGLATYWWLRSPYTYSTRYVWVVNPSGSCNYGYTSSSYGIRPAFILPSDTLVSNDGTIVT